ncbi:MAG: DNA adenine methylase [Legionellales bacterium]|nr:DNA adenine methylase [Legionellales bacterium]
MRYVGCKRRLLSFIHETIIKNNIDGNTFCDLFAGTATVGHYFKQQGYRIISSDLLYTSYVMQRVKVSMNQMPRFERLANHLDLPKQHSDYYAQAIIDYLNQLEGVPGFIYRHYSEEGTQNQLVTRLYYTDHNAKKIDIIRESVEAWKQLKLINEDEFFILLYALLNEASRCANTTGTMSSFLKHYSRKSLQKVWLKLPEIVFSKHSHNVYFGDSFDLLEQLEVDILYIDPPYTTNQYAASYHLLETIARWDFPTLHGVSGKRDIKNLYSPLSSKREAVAAIKHILESNCYKCLLMSYSSDGIVPHETLIQLFQQYGDVNVYRKTLKRYNTIRRADMQVNRREFVEERLYCLKPRKDRLPCLANVVSVTVPKSIRSRFQALS